MYAMFNDKTNIYYSDTKDTVGEEVRIWGYGDYCLVKLVEYIGEFGSCAKIYKYKAELIRPNPNEPTLQQKQAEWEKEFKKTN